MDEWTEPDGTVYRRKENGDYEIISPKKFYRPKLSYSLRFIISITKLCYLDSEAGLSAWFDWISDIRSALRSKREAEERREYSATFLSCHFLKH